MELTTSENEKSLFSLQKRIQIRMKIHIKSAWIFTCVFCQEIQNLCRKFDRKISNPFCQRERRETPGPDAGTRRRELQSREFNACNQGKHRVTKRSPALSYPMFTLVTQGPRHRWSLESCLCDSSPATTLRFTYDHGQVISLVVINDPDKETSMSKDGTVHELTSNAILFLQQLLEFQETAGAMLASQETSSAASNYSSQFSLRLLSTYICKVLGNLQLKLLSKSKMYEDLALGAIFLHNNYNYILKSLENWLKVIDYVNDKNLPPLHGAKLKDKERQMIKERFKGFNEGLEEICKIQKSWAIPDKKQRERIRQSQKKIVQEAYSAFLFKYGKGVNFTKNPDKYIKYSVEHVGEMIERLFDTSA
ncbi:unnamed protein product [Ranitomeya imitator]|uniref:Exocyst complex component 7 n=1 Tax=Ranitomeya imitator TaxID=111125 RepID=A0ABN9M1B1_9NEOB|nr:unnamed protein product [Ranitomeya imitator]